MLVNINYKARVQQDITHLPFNTTKPRQYVCKLPQYTIVIFPNRQCRIMGCKSPIKSISTPFNIIIQRIQSCTVVINLKQSLNLYKLSLKLNCIFEPELFPALRWLKYNPMCVNIFATGKVVVLGIKHLQYESIIQTIKNDLLNNLM